MEIEEGELILGRSRSCNVTLRDPTTSRHHVMLQVFDGEVAVKDLQSSNGTFVNGYKLSGRKVLEDGDRVTVGETDIVVRITEIAEEGAAEGPSTTVLLRICPSCGFELPAAAAFCPGCGRQLEGLVNAPGGMPSAITLAPDAPTAPVTERPKEPPRLPPPVPGPPTSDTASPAFGDQDLGAARSEALTRHRPPSRAAAEKPEFPPPAGFWLRLLAAVIDGGLVSLASLIVTLPFGGPMREAGSIAWLASSALLGFLVPVIGWSRWGTTPGKALFGLVVCSVEGRIGTSVPQAVLRWLSYLVSLVLFGIGFLMIGLTTAKRGIHDYLANTYVGRRR